MATNNKADKNLQFYSLTETQDILGVGRSKLWKMLNVDQVIPSYRIGRKVRVKHEDLEGFMEKSKVQYSEV